MNEIYENCVKYYENLKDTFTDFIKSSFLLNLFILNRYLKQTMLLFNINQKN